MTTTDTLINRSIEIITEYYRNNLQPYFDSLGEDVLWIGPAEGQMLRGREELIQTFSAEVHQLHFTMGVIRTDYVLAHRGVYEIVLRYEIRTHYPDGNTDVHDQRLHYTWRERRVRTDQGTEHLWEIAMIHISNAWQYDARDTIYPVHYENVGPQVRIMENPAHYLVMKDDAGRLCRIPIHQILYMETVKRSARLCVHTSAGQILVNGSLPALVAEWPKELVRIHASYVVNPDYVRSIERFAVILTDGTRLPIPEKKYTDVKRQLLG